MTDLKPFLLWAGGKRSLLPQLLPLFPKTFSTYHEPFLGGGAVAFELAPGRANLSDSNAQLMNAYKAVRDDVDGLIAILKGHPAVDEDFYYWIRALKPEDLTPTTQAARFIYLNRTCFNGLHRQNRAGQFNVPWGKRANPIICDEPTLRACSAFLQNKLLNKCDFETASSYVLEGDACYFDPPYHKETATSFTSYTAEGFGPEDQERLRDMALKLARRGVNVALSNSNKIGRAHV